jgi:hypothetical protein
MSKKQSLISSTIAPKYYWLIGILLIMVFFGDSIILFLGHLIHVILELIASILEHGLQIAFNLSERQAQIVLFYILLISGSFIAWQLAKTVYRKSRAFCRHAGCRVRGAAHEVNWWKISLILTAIGASIFVLS